MDKEFYYVVGIGASAGGQIALQQFLENLPDTPNAAFIIVTHLSKNHRTNLHTILSKCCSIPVSLINDSEPILKNRVYIMPENVTLVVADKALYLEPRGHSNVNRSINRFLITLAEDFRERAIGIILSGSGTDGADGVERLCKCGGKVFVQEPATSAFGSMPRAAIESDHPIAVESPGDLAKALMQLVDSHG